jgi:hypothetical protein
MKSLLYCNRQNLAAIEKVFSRNQGIDEVLVNPDGFRYQGSPLQLVDTAAMTGEDRISGYMASAMWPSAVRHYEVHPMFGTGKYKGIFFGEKVPALVIVDDMGEVLDIFPHRKAGQEVTIRELLTPAIA